ncbi:MAG TPA: hypothetical protein VHV77_04435 [Pirellulales bacterium]|jgi:hypothetical protein|nr:hypothetical protein [Pirellulales bacterium]
MKLLLGWTLLVAGACFAVLLVGCLESRSTDWLAAASFELYMALALGISGLSLVRKSSALKPSGTTYAVDG